MAGPNAGPSSLESLRHHHWHLFHTCSTLVMEKTPSLSTSSVLTGGPLETMAAFMDSDGVLRRSSSVTRRMLLRGASVGKEEFLRDPSSTDDSDSSWASAKDVQPDVVEDTVSEWRRRRSQLVSEIRHVKHELLVASNAKLQQRTQQWYDASETDPEAETTSSHTAQCPSPRARAFVDAEGNVRRKSANVEAAAHGGPASPTMRPSIVFEFMQAIID
jgi:hypothetical protein